MPAGESSNAPGQYDLTVAAGQLFFISSDGKGGQDLWASNGTASGTTVIKDITQEHTRYGNKEYYSLNVNNLTAAAGKLFFTADDPGGGEDLWASDGTTKGTTVLKHFQSNPSYGYYNEPLSGLTAAGGNLFFTVDDSSLGPQPWASNGTSSGTVMLADVNPGSAGSAPSDFTQFGSDVYFFMNESATTVGLWESDGTTAGTFKVFDGFPPLSKGGQTYLPTLGSLTPVGSQLFFTLEYGTPVPEVQLWTSDGTAARHERARPRARWRAARGSARCSIFMTLGNLLIFTADDGNGTALWESDGTAGGTTVVADQGPTVGNYGYKGYYDAYQTLVYGGILYFAGSTPADGVELWQTDGTAAGTQMVTDFSPATDSSDPAAPGGREQRAALLRG